MNTKNISSSVLKTSKFSRVRSTSENLDVFKSRDEIYLPYDCNVNHGEICFIPYCMRGV